MRVVSEENPESFKDSRYMWVGRDYKADMPLAEHLVELEDLGNLPEKPFKDKKQHMYYMASERIRDFISVNTGDIILLANSGYGYAFKGEKGEHGTLSLVDGVVPVEFAYPAGDREDGLIKGLKAYIEGSMPIQEEEGEEEKKEKEIKPWYVRCIVPAIKRYFEVE